MPFPSAGDLADPGIEPKSLEFPALAGGFFTTAPLGEHSTHQKNAIMSVKQVQKKY